MKFTVSGEGLVTGEEVYGGLILRTKEGNEISVCMRDDTMEINVMPGGEHTSNWWRVDMEKGVIEKQAPIPGLPVESNVDSGEASSNEVR